MNKKNFILLPRLLFIIPLGLFGIMHFVYPSFFLYMVPTFLESKLFWVLFSGVALTLASIAIGAKIIPKISSFSLMAFVLVFIITVDIPGMLNPETKFYSMVSFLKDISLFGGTLTYYIYFSYIEKKLNS